MTEHDQTRCGSSPFILLPPPLQERPDVHYSLLAIDFMPPPLLGRLLSRVAAKMADGRLRPLRNRLCYGLASAASALRALAQASHAGKVITLSPPRGPLAAAPPGGGVGGGASVAVTGGTGGLGLLLASWMVSTGAASRVVLLGRGGRVAPAVAEAKGHTDGGSSPVVGSASASAELIWSALVRSGAEIVVVAADSSSAEDAAAIWQRTAATAQSSGLHSKGAAQPWALDAVLHAAGVLTDAMLPNQSLALMRRWATWR